MNACFRTLLPAALLGLSLLAACDPKSPKVTADPRPASVDREQATGQITGSTGTATGSGGAGSTTTPGTPSGSLPEASGPAVSAGSEPTAGRSTGTPVGAGAGLATGGSTPTDTHTSGATDPGRSTAPAAGTAAPATAVPASRAASMAAGASDLADRPATPGASAQQKPGGDAPARGDDGASRLSSAERNFLINAAGLNLYEIEAARLGSQHAKSPAVQAYAKQLQRHHVQAQEQLQQLAEELRIKLPEQMPADRQIVIERLERTTPFDTAFVNTVGVQDHRSTIERYEKARRDAKDLALQAWIDKSLPALREHLAQARKLPGANDR